MMFNGGGLLIGGLLEGRLAHKGYRDSKMRVGVISAALHLPLAVLFPLMPTAEWALLVYCPTIMTNSIPFGCAPAAIQEMVPSRMRGQASAIYLLLLSLIAVGLGSTAVAVCTDYLFHDPLKLRYSIIAVGFTANLIGLVLLWSGLGAFRRTLDSLKHWKGGRTSSAGKQRRGGVRRCVRRHYRVARRQASCWIFAASSRTCSGPPRS